MGDYLNRVSALGMVGRGVLAVNECSQTKETASMEFSKSPVDHTFLRKCELCGKLHKDLAPICAPAARKITPKLSDHPTVCVQIKRYFWLSPLLLTASRVTLLTSSGRYS